MISCRTLACLALVAGLVFSAVQSDAHAQFAGDALREDNEASNPPGEGATPDQPGSNGAGTAGGGDAVRILPGPPPQSEFEPVELRGSDPTQPVEISGPRAERFEPQAPPRDPRLVPPDIEPQPEARPYEALGLKAGAFLWRPSIDLQGFVTDNVGQSASNRKADIGVQVIPQLIIESDWPRHAFTFTGSGTFILHDSEPEQDSTSASLNSTLRLDVRSTTTLDMRFSYDLSETGSSSSEVPDAATGKRQDQTIAGSAVLTHRMGRLVAALTAGAAYNDFADVELQGGGTETNEDRNYLQPEVRLRLSIESGRAISPYVEAAYSPRLHDEKVDRNGLKRDSHGVDVEAGFVLAANDVWTGELGLRYSLRDFDDPTLKSIEGIGVEGRLEWRPSVLTTVRLVADTSVSESAAAGISGSRVNGARIEVDHLLRDYLRLSFGGGFQYTDFIGSSADDVEWQATAGLSYFIRRGFEFTAVYTFEELDSGTPGSGFVEHRFATGFRYSF